MIGKSVSHYKIVESLGQGGMGVVYKAEDTKLKRTVALKFLPSAYSSDIAAKERFVHEAQAASALDHPNICTIHEIGETDDGQSYIAMACYEGLSLKDRMAQCGLPPRGGTKEGVKSSGSDTPLHPPLPGGKQIDALSIEESITLIIQIARGLQKAHDNGIIHRDIKPANIMITEDNTVKILDFGLAKLAGQTRLTKTGSTVGTIAYMSPEQAKGEPVDQQTDIWSLGVVLYEMLTGQLPFKGEYEQAMIYTILNEEPLPVSVLNEDVSAELEQIVYKCLAKDPENRYQSIDEFLLYFKGFDKELDISFDESLPKLLRRIWRKSSVRLSTVFAGIVILILAALILFWPKHTQPIPIALIHFNIQTGDARDDWLSLGIPDLLLTSLQQTDRFQPVGFDRLRDLLKQIGKDNLDKIDRDTGFELCRMDGISKLGIGSYTKMGEVRVMDLKILDVETKDIVQTAQSKGYDEASILNVQIDDLAKQLLKGIGGMDEEKLEHSYQPVIDKTTYNLEAYKYFILGENAVNSFNYEEARRFIERAVEIDSTYTNAYYYLANIYMQLGDKKKEMKAWAKAKKYIDHTSELIRLHIEANYIGFIEGNWEKADSLQRETLNLYPEDTFTLYNLGVSDYEKGLYANALEKLNRVITIDSNFYWAIWLRSKIYIRQGEYDKAIQSLEKYALNYPENPAPYITIGDCYFKMGKIEQAVINLNKTLYFRPNDQAAGGRISYIYALQENYTLALKSLDEWIAGQPEGLRGAGHRVRSFYYAWLGQFTLSAKEMNEAKRIFDSLGNTAGVRPPDYGIGIVYYEGGKFELSRQAFNTYLKNAPQEDADLPLRKSLYTLGVSMLDLNEGKIDSAKYRISAIEPNLKEVKEEFWNDRINYLKQNLLAETLLLEGKLDQAMDAAKKSSVYVYEGYFPVNSFPSNRDILARIYIIKGKVKEAIAEYERLTTIDPASKDRRLIPPKYHYHLGKLYEQTGQIDQAIKRYERFLELWKNADADQADLIEAKKRLAGLIKNSDL